MVASSVAYFSAESMPGNSAPPFVNVPSPTNGTYAVVIKVEVFIRTKDGKRKISAKDIMVERFANGVEDADRTPDKRLNWFTIPICGPERTEVIFAEDYKPYNSIVGFAGLSGRGLRISLSGKDRASDYQRISIGISVTTEDSAR